MFLCNPPETAAAARLRASDAEQLGFVMNLTRLWAWRPDTSEAFSAARAQLMQGSSLSAREFAVLVCAMAATLQDAYCALAWGKRLAEAADPGIAAAVLRNAAAERLPPREQALDQWARKVVKEPNATTAGDIATLRAAGLTEREIFEATVFVAFRLAFSTVNDALGARPDAQVAAAAPAEVRSAVTFGRPAAGHP